MTKSFTYQRTGVANDRQVVLQINSSLSARFPVVSEAPCKRAFVHAVRGAYVPLFRRM